MDALELTAFLNVVTFVSKTLPLIISQDLQAKDIPGVLLLLDGPLAVLFIESDPVVVNILIDFDIADLERREALVERLLQEVTEVPDKVENDEGDHHGPLDAVPALVGEDVAHGVLGDVGVRGKWGRRKIIIAEKLLAGSHPVAKDKVQKRRKL